MATTGQGTALTDGSMRSEQEAALRRRAQDWGTTQTRDGRKKSRPPDSQEFRQRGEKGEMAEVQQCFADGKPFLDQMEREGANELREWGKGSLEREAKAFHNEEPGESGDDAGEKKTGDEREAGQSWTRALDVCTVWEARADEQRGEREGVSEGRQSSKTKKACIANLGSDIREPVKGRPERPVVCRHEECSVKVSGMRVVSSGKCMRFGLWKERGGEESSPKGGHAEGGGAGNEMPDIGGNTCGVSVDEASVINSDRRLSSSITAVSRAASGTFAMTLEKLKGAVGRLFLAAGELEEQEEGLLEVVEKLAEEAMTTGSRWQIKEERGVQKDRAVGELRDAMVSLMSMINKNWHQIEKDDIFGLVQSGILVGGGIWQLSGNNHQVKTIQWGLKIGESVEWKSRNRSFTAASDLGSFGALTVQALGLPLNGAPHITGSNSVHWKKDHAQQEKGIKAAIAKMLGWPKDSSAIAVEYKQAWASKIVEGNKVSTTSTAKITFTFGRNSTEERKVRSLLEGCPFFPMGSGLMALTPAPTDVDLTQTGQPWSGRQVEWVSNELQEYIERGAGSPESPLYSVAKVMMQQIVVSTLSSALEKAGMAKERLPIDPAFEIEGTLPGRRSGGSLSLRDGRSGIEFWNEIDIGEAVGRCPKIELPDKLFTADMFSEYREGYEGLGMSLDIAKGDKYRSILWASRKRYTGGSVDARLESEAVQKAALKSTTVYITVRHGSEFVARAQAGKATAGASANNAIQQEAMKMLGEKDSYVTELYEGGLLRNSPTAEVKGDNLADRYVVIKLPFGSANEAMSCLMALETGEKWIGGISKEELKSVTFSYPFNRDDNMESLRAHVGGLKKMVEYAPGTDGGSAGGSSDDSEDKQEKTNQAEVRVVIPKDSAVIAAAKFIVIQEMDHIGSKERVVGIERVMKIRRELCTALEKMLKEPELYKDHMPEDLKGVVKAQATVANGQSVVKVECPVEMVITVKSVDAAQDFVEMMKGATKWGGQEVWGSAQVREIQAGLARTSVKDKGTAGQKETQGHSKGSASVVRGVNSQDGQDGRGDGSVESPTKVVVGKMQQMSMGEETNAPSGVGSFMIPMGELQAKLAANKQKNDGRKVVFDLCARTGVSTTSDKDKWWNAKLDDSLIQEIRQGVARIETLAARENDVQTKGEAAGEGRVSEMIQGASRAAITAISAAKLEIQREVINLMAAPDDGVEMQIGHALSMIKNQCEAGAVEAQALELALEKGEWQLMWKGHIMRAMSCIGGDDFPQQEMASVEAVVAKEVDQLAEGLAGIDMMQTATEGIAIWANEMSTAAQIKEVWDKAKSSGDYEEVVVTTLWSLQHARNKIQELAQLQQGGDGHEETADGVRMAEAARIESDGINKEARKRAAVDETVGGSIEVSRGSALSPGKKSKVEIQENQQTTAVASNTRSSARSRSVTPMEKGVTPQGNAVSPPPNPGEEGSK